MRKLLASDYDGTFLTNNADKEHLDKNRISTIDFMKCGNLFVFASGRNYISIKKQIDLYDLPYHYLVCNNGTSIFDSKGELIHYNLIGYSSVIKTINYLNRKNIILSKKYLDIYGNETENYREVAEIICTVNISTPEMLEEVKNEISFLQSIFFTSASSQICTVADISKPISTQYLVIKEPSDKKEAICFIADMETINAENIYTIGNDFNDYGMLECYNGFKMLDSRSELELLDIPEVASVHELIKRIEG